MKPKLQRTFSPKPADITRTWYVVDAADFVFLRRQTGLTGGNLSSHMGKLEAAGYVDVEKSFVDKRPQTMFRLTEAGWAAFQDYRTTMEELLSRHR